MSVGVALCHSSGAGKPFGRHGVKRYYSDIVKDLAGLYKPPWDVPFGLLEVEEIPRLFSFLRACHDFCDVPGGLWPGKCSQAVFTLALFRVKTLLFVYVRM